MVEVVEVEVEVVAEVEASAFRCTLPYALDEAKSGGSPSGVLYLRCFRLHGMRAWREHAQETFSLVRVGNVYFYTTRRPFRVALKHTQTHEKISRVAPMCSHSSRSLR